MRSRFLMCGLVLVCAACATDPVAPKARGGAGLIETVPVHKAPEGNRCDSTKLGCQDALYLAQNYARRLATGDEVCLEGGFGKPPTGECLARAAVIDTAPNRVLIEVRSAKPTSKYFQQEIHQMWFEEGALVDLALEEAGY